MNTYIETLNHWGENALAFAWPMLWQSSLLIVVVFALDCLLARRVRAAVRHALWMVVLVKLLLPPALALPTGATWWLWPAKPELVPVFKNETVTFDTSTLPDNFVPQTAPLAPPPLKLSAAGWAMLASGAMSAGLLFSLLYQWLKVERRTRRPYIDAVASGDFANALEQARQSAGLRRPMRLRLVDDAISPAVYGLFRPLILLPRALAEKLSAAQLRAVLLHEAIHLRRGDVRVNCAQTLLQIAYWWHPLLWLANARIRRLREEAVDDAVMVALRGDADAYAPTLLEVAKFAFRRPLASLGLVGILESRSALRQRVERLVDFRPPRRAGVTFLSLCGIFLFGAVVLPMGQAPAAITESASLNSPSPMASPSSPKTIIFIEGRFLWMRSSSAEALTSGLPYDGGQAGEAPKWKIGVEKWDEINQRIKSLHARLFQRPRIQTVSGMEADFYVGSPTNWIELDCNPFLADGQIKLDLKAVVGSVSRTGKTNLLEVHGHPTMENQGGIVMCAENPNDSSSNLVLVISAKTIETVAGSLDKTNTSSQGVVMTSAGREDIQRKLEKIHLDTISFQQLPLNEVIRNLREQSLRRNPDKTGINFLFNPNIENIPATNSTAREGMPVQIDPATGLPVKAAPLDAAQINITLNLTDVSLADLLNAICQVADHPLKYSVEDYGIVFSDKKLDAPKYVMRTFKVDADRFVAALHQKMPDYKYSPPSPPDTKSSSGGYSWISSAPDEVTPLVRQYFEKQNINLDMPKSILFNARLGVLFVYATPKDLDVIERAIQVLNSGNPPAATSHPDPRHQAADLARAGQVSYEAGDMDVAKGEFESALALDPNNQGAQYYLTLISQAAAALPSGVVSLRPGPVRILNEIRNIHLDAFGPFDHASLVVVVSELNSKARQAGADFGMAVLDPAPSPPDDTVVTLPQLKNVALGEAFRRVRLAASSPINYTILDDLVAFSPAKPKDNFDNLTEAIFDPSATHPSYRQVSATINTNDLVERTFLVGTAAFIAAVRSQTGEASPVEGFRELAAKAGVDFSPPKTIFLTEGEGALSVYATKKDMDTIRDVLDGLHCSLPQVHIKARFFEMPSTSAEGLPSGMGILTASEMKTVLPLLMSQKGVKELAEPEGTTLTGRQMQMTVGEVDPVVTNYVIVMPPGAKTPAIEPQIGNVEFGVMFDAVPVALADGYTISLKATGKRTQFFGYAAPKGIKEVTTNYEGSKITLPVTLPAIQMNTASSQALLYDGQTLVLFPNQPEPLFYPSDEKSQKLVDEHIRQVENQNGHKTLVVFATITLIDPAGNRLHSDKEMSFAQKGPPAQPQTLPDERQNLNFPGVAPSPLPVLP